MHLTVFFRMQTQIDRGETLWLLCSPIIILKVKFFDEYIYAQVELLTVKIVAHPKKIVVTLN